MNKKKFIISFSLISLFFILIFSNSILSKAYQDDSDLEATLHCRLESDSSEIYSSSMPLGTYAFFDTPELDTGEFSHDTTLIEVEDVQSSNLTSLSSEKWLFQGNNLTEGNQSFSMSQQLPEYSVSGGLDTKIQLNVTYISENYSLTDTFSDECDNTQWSMEDDYGTPVSFQDIHYEATNSYNNRSFNTHWVEHDGLDGSDCKVERIVDGHLTVVELEDHSTNSASSYNPKHNVTFSAQESGTIEFWVRTDDMAKNNYWWGYADDTIPTADDRALYFRMSNSKIQYYDGDFHDVSTGLSADTWYHIRIDFECGSGGYQSLSADTFDCYVNAVKKVSGGNFWYAVDDIEMFIFATQSTPEDFSEFIDAVGLSWDEDYAIGDNYNPSGLAYIEQSSTKELTLTSSIYSEDIRVNYNDSLFIEGYISTSNTVTLSFFKDSVSQYSFNLWTETEDKEYYLNSSFDFDQYQIQGIFDVDDYFALTNLTIRGYSNDNIFDSVYLEDFKYQVLGINYTSTYSLTLDSSKSDYSQCNGTYIYYLDSSRFKNYDHVSTLTIPLQNISLIFDIYRNLSMTLNTNITISYSENSFKVPTEVDMEINNEEVIDDSLSSGYVYLSEFAETLEITADEDVNYELNITSYFTFTFDLDVISKTYLKKAFKLLSDHSIIIERIDLPAALDIKKIYLNSIDLGYDNPNELSPERTMNQNNIFTLEVLLADELYIPLPYINDLATSTYEYLYSNYFNYQSSDMLHLSYIDGYNDTYGFSNRYLELKNEFPNEFKEESWSNWNNNYNESYIESSESNGEFSSRLNTHASSSLPTQPTDFTFTNGSYNSTEWSIGDLNEIDDDYSVLNGSSAGGYSVFPATFSFTDDATGTEPTGWSITETGAATVEVVDDYKFHGKVVKLDDTAADASINMEDSFSDQATGTVELWLLQPDDDENSAFKLYDGSVSHAITLYFDTDGNIKYWDGSSHTITSYNADQWYHFKVEWDCATDWHLWIDEVSQDGGAGYGFQGTPSAIDHVLFYTDAAPIVDLYVDAIGYSWDPEYNIGDNLVNSSGSGESALNFNVTFDFDTSLIRLNETLDHVELQYSINLSLADIYMNISIWNFDLNRFIVVNFSTGYNFHDLIFVLNSSVYNGTYHVILNFNASNDAFFRLYLDKLKISYNWTKTSGQIYSNFSKKIDYSFLNRYDTYLDYHDLFNVSVSFNYRFTNHTIYSSKANVTIADNSTLHDLTTDGSWHQFTHEFEFNSSSEDYFWITLNMTNGLLEISEMNYTIVFKCLDLESKTKLFQYFKLDPSLSLSYYEKTEGRLYLNFSYTFTPGDTAFTYSNNSLLEFIISVQTEDSIIESRYSYNTSQSATFSLNIKQLVTNNSKEQVLDVYLELYLFGNNSQLTLDNYYLLNKLQRIQVTKNPRTEIDSVEFIDYLVASRDFKYWYFQNSKSINNVDVTNKRTDETTSSFDIENSKYYFIDEADENDIYESNLDYDPNWDISYTWTSSGTSSTLTIKYKADMEIENVTLVLDLSDDDLYMGEWDHNATQDEDTFILEVPYLTFTTIEKTIVLHGTSDIPHATIKSFECQEIPIIDSNFASKNYTYKGYLKYDRYSRSYIIDDINSTWEIDGVHYGSSVMTVDNQGYFETRGGAYDSSITSSYLQFRANPISDFGVYDYENGTLLIKIDCNLPIQNASVWFGLPTELRYQLKSSGLDFVAAIGDIAGYDYYYFFYNDLQSGENKIFIEYEIYSVNNLGNYLVVLFMITFGFLGVWWYRERHIIKEAEKTLSEKELAKFYKERQERGGLFTMMYRSITGIFKKKTPAEKARQKKEQLKRKEERELKRSHIWR